MIKLTTTAIASLMTICSQCDAPAPPERPAQVIYIPYDYAHGFRAEAGDTIIAIMDPGPNNRLNCEGSGGTLEQNYYTDIWLCHDMDF